MSNCSNTSLECSDAKVSDDSCRSACGSPCATKKIPLWATILAVGGFVIFNVIFIAYAISVSSGVTE